MCGIAGIVVQKRAPAFADVVRRMCVALVHRGPDSQDVVDLGNCALGNTRLAIVDLSERGRMPMCNEERNVWISYNGECYNADEFRPLLEARGYRLRSSTDTEVVLHLYEEFGEQCVVKLRGMFAFAIWDAREKKLLLARDRLGIKPLYFSASSEKILFGSEIKALLASELLPRKVDPAGIRAFLQLGHMPPPWSAVAGVKPLQPGSIAVWQNGRFRTDSYWEVPQVANGRSAHPCMLPHEQLREILLESSRLQLMSDVPIALFLSGGVDSAVLGSLMRTADVGPLTALTIGFEDRPFDESETSRQTAQQLGITHEVVRLDPSRVAANIDDAVLAMDQPTVDGLNTYWISRLASEAGFRVALSGQGGDELFGGYDSLVWFDRFTQVAKYLRFLPAAVGPRMFDHQALPFRWRKLSYLIGADDPFVASQLAVRLLFLDHDVASLLSPGLAISKKPLEATSFISTVAEKSIGELSDRIAFVDFRAHLEARLLRDGDAMSMAHSLEIRPVLLDHKVVEFVMSLPARLRLQKKKLLLDATRECMPAGLYSALITRPKRTFTFPFDRWISQNLRHEIEGTFSSGRLNATAVLNANRVQDLWRRYLANPGSVGWSRIWSIFVLAKWCETMKIGI